MPRKSPESKARAVALCAEGHTQKKAGELTGMSDSTVGAAWREADKDERTAIEDRLLGQQAAIVELASGEILHRLQDDSKREKMNVNELSRLAGVGIDKIALRQGWSKGSSSVESFADALGAAIAGGASLSLEVSAADRAIDVTAGD